MAWTSPATWVAGAVVTATQLNTGVRDNLKAIGDPWTSYTPTWTAATSNPVIGNGTLTGGYTSVGKMVHFWAQIVMGTTTTYGTGGWSLSLPVSESAHRWTFQGSAYTGAYYDLIGHRDAAGKLLLLIDTTSAGGGQRNIATGVPVSWGLNDTVFISGVYEAA